MLDIFKRRNTEPKKEEKTFYAGSSSGEKRTTLSLSLTVSDKKALKMLAAERGTTIAAIIHEWIVERTGNNKEFKSAIEGGER